MTTIARTLPRAVWIAATILDGWHSLLAAVWKRAMYFPDIIAASRVGMLPLRPEGPPVSRARRLALLLVFDRPALRWIYGIYRQSPASGLKMLRVFMQAAAINVWRNDPLAEVKLWRVFMAAVTINFWRNAFLVNLTATDYDYTTASKLQCQLMTSSHSFNTETDEDLDTLTSGNRVMISVGFTGIVAGTGANLDAADDVVLTDTNNARVSSHAYILYTGGSELLSPLISHDSSIVITSDGTNDELDFNASGILDL